jgi:CheY-like chemotaxis protein
VTADEWINLLKAVGGILGVLVWPALILFLVLRYHEGIGGFFKGIKGFTFKGPGFEATAVRDAEFYTLVGAAETKREAGIGASDTKVDPRAVVSALSDTVSNPRAQRSFVGAHVLWVDDMPDNNVYEREALEALGIRVTNSISTEDALKRWRTQHFNLIISDMSRPPDDRAGYTLLKELRDAGDQTPVIIYAGSATPAEVAEVKARGARGQTSSPTELMQLVLAALI